MEEFQEADVIWADHWTGDVERPIRLRESLLKSSRRGRGESDPVKIPNRRSLKARDGLYQDYEEDEKSEKDEMVPPHLVIARRIARKTTFSVCTGSGRTLKGRDLSRMRNSVLRMTGFLEG
ncbi:protein S40-1-like [Aristolochia californica]|uniref:protein S40-1-like n=1 Tax=Aristolochia californica TaxID=171875 RepID=UPI0035DEF96F